MNLVVFEGFHRITLYLLVVLGKHEVKILAIVIEILTIFIFNSDIFSVVLGFPWSRADLASGRALEL